MVKIHIVLQWLHQPNYSYTIQFHNKTNRFILLLLVRHAVSPAPRTTTLPLKTGSADLHAHIPI
jgi:hypothetical protein